MADITAAMVKDLRETTGAGMMDCKKALVDTNGDFDAAVKLLKEKGLAAVAKRAERATSEGRIFIRQNGNKVAVVELVRETDFVAKNAEFIACGEKILDEIFAKGYTEINKELSDVLLDFATRTRENMSLSKIQVIDVPENSVAGIYIHSDFKTAAVTVIKGSTDEKVKEFARDCCMHLAAFTPAYIKRDDVDAAYIAEQREIFTKQVESLDKPENVKKGIVEGKVNKHLAEICFMDQPFVKDDKVSVTKKMEEIGKNVGAKLAIAKVVSYQLGA